MGDTKEKAGGESEPRVKSALYPAQGFSNDQLKIVLSAMQAQIDAADSRAANLLTELSKLQSRFDEQTLIHKGTLEKQATNYQKTIDEQASNYQKTIAEQASNYQKTIDEQASNYQKTIAEQASQHSKALVHSSAQIEKLKEQVDDLRIELKKATGQAPKSERNRGNLGSGKLGGGDGNDGNGNPPEEPKPEQTNKEKYDRACLAYKKRKLEKLREEEAAGRNPSDDPLTWHSRMGSDMSLVPASEHQMDCPIGVGHSIKHPWQSLSEQDKLAALGTTKGLKIGTVATNRYGFRIQAITESIEYEVVTTRESLNDDGQFKSDSICAAIGQYGPPNTQVTWEGMTNALILCSTFAIPMERIGRIVGNSYFNAKNISRWVQWCAWQLLPIYLWLFSQLARASVIKMDDTKIIVEEMSKLIANKGLVPDSELEADIKEYEIYFAKLRLIAKKRGIPPLVPDIAEVTGRVSSYRGTDESKESYNLSCISWLLDPFNTRSTVLFFRTHFGSCANLVSNALRNRSSKSQQEVNIIADCAATNNLDPSLTSRIKIIYQGCYHHARRHIKSFESKDSELASFLLERFLRLDEYEWEAFTAPVTQEKISEARRKSQLVWQEIKEVAANIIDGKQHPKAKNFIWKQGTKAYNGCRYIIKHYDELTLYLTDQKLSGNNTFIERALRPQKRIMESVPVRKSESSQCGFDIVRTFAATCECAGINFNSFLKNIMQVPRELILQNPGEYAPFGISKP